MVFEGFLLKPLNASGNSEDRSGSVRAVLRGRDFFFFFFTVKDRPLRTGPDLEFSQFSPVPEKNAELGFTGQKFSGAHARRFPFFYIWAGDGIFFFSVKDRPGERVGSAGIDLGSYCAEFKKNCEYFQKKKAKVQSPGAMMAGTGRKIDPKRDYYADLGLYGGSSNTRHPQTFSQCEPAKKYEPCELTRKNYVNRCEPA